jgi:hypothetical protein
MEAILSLSLPTSFFFSVTVFFPEPFSGLECSMSSSAHLPQTPHPECDLTADSPVFFFFLQCPSHIVRDGFGSQDAHSLRGNSGGEPGYHHQVVESDPTSVLILLENLGSNEKILGDVTDLVDSGPDTTAQMKFPEVGYVRPVCSRRKITANLPRIFRISAVNPYAIFRMTSTLALSNIFQSESVPVICQQQAV